MANWEKGDLALRVAPVTPSAARRTGIRQGGVYTVSQVVYAPDGRPGLRFEGITNLRGQLCAANAARFVKVTPGKDVQGFEEPRRLPVKENA